MIINKIRAGYPGLYLVTHEEQRAEAMILATVEDLKAKHGQEWQLFAWTIADGRYSADGTETFQEDALEVLAAIEGMPKFSLLILKDYHMLLDPATAIIPLPILLRKLKNALFHAENNNKVIILLSPVLKLPVELEKLIDVIDFTLPDKEQLTATLTAFCDTNALPVPGGIDLDQITAAASGLTTNEAKDAFSLAQAEVGRLDPAIVNREKAHTIAKNGLVEIREPKETLDSIGGFGVAKQWLLKRRAAFSSAAAYQLPPPRGVVVLGVPGTGKSLFSKVTSVVLGVPLLRLDAGKLFAGHVGESEHNLRAVCQMAEAIAPCVLWIDEAEKGFSGSKSSGSTDGGTAARVFGSFLQWMQEKKKPVFVVITANDVSALPPEFLRKGRFDELFFVDLPTEQERLEIWGIQIAKYGRTPKSFNLAKLAQVSDGFTGSEIEAVFIESLYHCFDEQREPKTEDILPFVKECVPLSKMMADEIQKLQEWAKGRTRRASLAAPTPIKSMTPNGRKIAA